MFPARDTRPAVRTAQRRGLPEIIAFASSPPPDALKAPEQLSGTVERLAAPLTRIVGTPSELRAHAVAGSRDWLEVQHRFQTALLDALYPPAVTVEVPKTKTS